ncbi:MAG: DUF4105 domain-containing protein [Flavobacterium sp.]|nr:DUF4105 domain-containing protein [Flavobacterium sp.]
MAKKLLYFFCFLFSLNAFSQAPVLSENATVSVFTCGRGEQLYSTFGHTAIRIKDEANQLDVVYNYGAFDFNTENFYFKFVKGDLQYFIVATSFQEFIYEYQYDNREVIEQTLNFSKEKKQALFERLNASLFSEERSYTYKFIDRNCTTMVTDKINQTIGALAIKKVDDTSITYREVLYPYFGNYFWYNLGINIIFGAKTDQKAEQLFLPIELLHSLDKAQVNGKPLVLKKQTLVPEVKKSHAFSFVNSIYFVALILLVLVVLRKTFVYKTYLFIAGILGLFLCLVGLYSLHQEVLWNYNALLFNPLFLVLPFFKNEKLKKLLWICFGLLAIYLIIIVTKPYLVLMIPFIATHLVILYQLLQTTKKV